MKNLFTFIAFLLVLLSIPLTIAAHSGGTDASGGHYNSTTGEYHYHHGYPAHDHKNKICPYDEDFFDKKEEQIKDMLEEMEEEEKIRKQNDKSGIYFSVSFVLSIVSFFAFRYSKKHFNDDSIVRHTLFIFLLASILITIMAFCKWRSMS